MEYVDIVWIRREKNQGFSKTILLSYIRVNKPESHIKITF